MGLMAHSKRTSSTIAKDRLKQLLVSERLDCSPTTLIMLKKDLIRAVSKYMLVDEANVSVQYSQAPDMLVAQIPFLPLMHQIEDRGLQKDK